MEIKFESNLDFQKEAISSVIDLFKGQKSYSEDFTILPENGVIPNSLELSEQQILTNLQIIQKRNNIEISKSLDGLDFSVEMETGTGKTYVYLRTILELNQNYGLKKFIIIVPSVAIREGVLKNLNITKQHFEIIYHNIPFSYHEYDSKRLNIVRQFSRTNKIEILIITLDSFNKEINIMNLPHNRLGDQRPIELISQTRPILILDEPQNMESEKAKKAISNLNPLFTLRYSATHRNYYNLVSRLTPIDAYNLKIVKRIEVASVVREGDFNEPYVKCLEIKAEKKGIKAKLEVNRKLKTSIKPTKMFVKSGEDLSKKTNFNEYAGYVVTSIDARTNVVKFSNGVIINLGEEHGGDKADMMKAQIEQTVEEHFQKYNHLKKFGVKVLSLFFIDRVDNYLKNEGIIRKLFIDSFNQLKLKPEYSEFKDIDVNTVHSGYFSKMKSEKGIEDDKEAYELIMKSKERLLSFDEPVQFIFTHSALKEGWDNPNIFNICTLNQTQSIIKKRQEIGRGLRIPVNQEGERIHETVFGDHSHYNSLTVIANESYSDYVSKLQKEYFDEYGTGKAPTIVNRRKRTTVNLKQDFALDQDFRDLWSRISKKTRYNVNIDTDNFVKECVDEINHMVITPSRISVSKVELSFDDKKEIETKFIGADSKYIQKIYSIPDVIDEITNDTHLTRSTVVTILNKVDNLESIFSDPQQYVDLVINIIKEKLEHFLVNGIVYTEMDDTFKMDMFKNIETYADKVTKAKRSIYDGVVYDSDIEKKFVIDLNDMNDVKLFIKLPSWYTIQTPIGEYNPDWAIVLEKHDKFGKAIEKMYFVSETKGSTSLENLRPSEKRKIECAKRHFGVIGVKYDVVKDATELRTKIYA